MRARCLVALSAVMLSLGIANVSSDDRLPESAVVAIVDGEPIRYAPIELTSDVLVGRFRRTHEREPTSERDRDSLERDKLQLERAKLKEHIRATVRKKQIARFRIEPTDQEIEQRWAQYVAELERDGEPFILDQRVEKMRAFLRELLEAYREVKDDSRDADIVYRQRFSDVMSYEEWQMRLVHEATPERRRSLERILALPDSDFFNPREDARMMLMMEKLIKAVEDDLIRTDPEFAEHMRLVTTDPRNEKLQARGPLYKDAKRYDWWQQRYREAKVEIKNDRFKGVWKEPFD